MNPHMIHHSASKLLLSLGLLVLAAFPGIVCAASLSLATTPLATSTTSAVKPNLLFILDDSSSMSREYMPDTVNSDNSDNCYRNNYYNGVYYNPDLTYTLPVDAAGTSYAASSFGSAKTNGFNSSSSTVNLNTKFSTGDGSDGNTAYYYTYTGASPATPVRGTCYADASYTKHVVYTTPVATISVSSSNGIVVSGITVNGVQIMDSWTSASWNNNDTASMIASRITLNGFTANATGSVVTISGPNSAAGYTPAAPTVAGGSATFTRTAFTAVPDAAMLADAQNFANWYTYYRNRMLMMKSAAGLAFKNIGDDYRVGYTTIGYEGVDSADNRFLAHADFNYVGDGSGHKEKFYSKLYAGGCASGICYTPLRGSLSKAGRLYAGQLLTGADDPVQYSCQQNFTILSTDGYWNDNDESSSAPKYGPYRIDNDTLVGNQDGTVLPPMHDGGQEATTVTTTYTQEDYSETGTRISSSEQNCATSYRRITVQPQTRSCSVTNSVETCTSWVNGTKYYLSPYTGFSSSCVHKDSVSVPTPDPSTAVATGSVTTTGAIGGTDDTLADVAMYYYQTDLRTSTLVNCTGSITGENLCTNNVFTSTTDNNVQQHMTTFTLGMGADGRMVYSDSYQTDTSGDYYDIKLEQTADASHCTWQSADTVCTWPIPGSENVENIDDLWHAAVNGRGVYFSATDPTSLSNGLSNALAGINARKGAAAAAATSTLNPVAGNNSAYVASYTTVKWHGNLEARGINTDTGAVNENASWCVEDVVAGACSAPGTVVSDTAGDTTSYYCVTPDSLTCPDGVLDGTNCRVPVAVGCTGTMNSIVSDSSDTRSINTANSTGTALVSFTYANLTSTQKAYFDAANIVSLNQWSSLSATQRTTAAGSNLVNYLRGQSGFELTASDINDQLYRSRDAVLGDALESQPAFIGAPNFSYPYPGYAAYKTAQASRGGTVYIGANDGMMHAFNAATGVERWAYVPSEVIPKMWKLADTSYSTSHQNFVNGSPVTTDICISNCTNAASAVWKTILVAGLNGGGRGYFALDITDPASPSLLWEFTTMSGHAALAGYDDNDVGYSFGLPIVTRKNDGTWVVIVSSGYNNTLPGDGKGYLYVLNASTGAIISKISTATGSTATPSGLAKVAGWNNETGGNLIGYAYGGDLLGNLWRFDINSPTAAAVGTGSVMKFAELYSNGAGTLPQPITTAPVLGKISGKRIVIVGTGKYLETTDLTTTQTQSLYAIKDDDAAATLVNPRNTLVNQTLLDNPDGTATRVSSNNTVNFYTGRGWYIDFPDSGERVNIDSRLVLGVLLVPSIVPSNTTCSPGGYGWLNFLDYKTGGAINTVSAVHFDAPIVGFNVMYIGGTPMVAAVTSSDPTPQLTEGVEFPPSEGAYSGKHVIWRELNP